ncbi:MAG: phenylalanine--tRNA ligase subunit beta [Candidatus Nealsonbacteria bacterium]|nr:phenylalanine--tRNA ligase subunit beta [Candidatus Nealsonbacteria bacterium]
MIFSYNWLQSFFNRKLPKPDKLAELLTMRSFEVEEVKKTGSDWVLNIDVLPNRAGDCFSHLGIAREAAALLNFNFAASAGKLKLIEDKNLKAKDFVSIEVKSQSCCPRYTARVIADVKAGPSPKWLKDRLEVCGLNSINNIVDAANYVMLETGQPLHAFDLEKLEDKKIIVRFAKEGEKITTLDNQVFNLDSKILVIADAKKPVAIAGIKGGKLPEIDESTKTIVLESANFDSSIIRKGSKELNLKSDASLRFEHKIDPNLAETAINKAAILISQIAGGKIVSGLIDFYPQKVYPKKIKLDLNYAESLLGVKIPVMAVKDILSRLGFKIKNLKLKIFDVEVPTFRLDVSVQEDLIEEVGRIYGYDKIPAVFPTASLIPPQRNDNIFWADIVKDIFREMGFTEAYNYSFQKELGEVEVENPQSQEYRYLRPSLIPNLLRNIEKNIGSFNQIKIFELGKVFRDKTEKTMLTGVVSGEDFYRLKGIMDLLFDKLGIAKVWYDDYQATPEDSHASLWNFKKSAEIKVGDIEVGFLGELKNDPRLTAFDLDFEKLKTLATEEKEYRPISKYPATIRDLAVLVPPLTRVEEVLNVIETAGGSLVIDVDLFDIYQGDEIADGKKNLAFHIIYQAQDRTLTSIEVYKIHQNIIKALEENPTWQVRK